ncbi:hypothetical protein CRUP_024553, partial [Coryphaenoides rupestris]
MAPHVARNLEERPEPFSAQVKGKSLTLRSQNSVGSSRQHGVPDAWNESILFPTSAGCLPSWLKGTLLRNGPGVFTVGETSYNHWFDGMALMQSFTFKDGEVTYRSRYLKGDTYNANMAAKRIVVAITFLNHTVPDFTDNGASNFIRYGNEIFATSETNYIRKIDPVTLETLEKVDYLKFIAVNMVTSHPHYDKEGNTYNIGTSIAERGKTKYTLFKVPAASEAEMGKCPLKRVEVLSSVPCRSLLSPSYYHSFGMTENYFVFVEQPLKLDIVKMATAYMRGVNWASCLRHFPEETTLIHLIDRKTGKEVATKFLAGQMVFYHHVNAFEDDGHVIFDVIGYDDNSLYDMFYLDKLKENAEVQTMAYSKPTYRRFALPLREDAGAVGENLVTTSLTTATAVKEKEGKLVCTPEVVWEGFELPRINYQVNGQKHRFVYGCCTEKSAVATEVGKLDTETKEIVRWSEDNCWPSEPVFVSRPDAESEDDGVVLVSVTTNPGQAGFILVLDGETFKEVARAY